MGKFFVIVAFFGIISVLQASALYADNQKLGKIFIRAAVPTIDGQQFPDKGREESVKDLRKRAGNFIVVDDESEADYLLVLVERNRRDSVKVELVSTISYKEDGQWKPGGRLTASSNGAGMAARRMMGQASDWVRGEQN